MQCRIYTTKSYFTPSSIHSVHKCVQSISDKPDIAGTEDTGEQESHSPGFQAT